MLPASAERTQNGAEKTNFENFLSQKQRTVSPVSQRTISVKFEHKTRIGLSKFLRKGSFSPRNLILGFLTFGGYICGAQAPAVAFSATVNLSIALYSPRAKDAVSSMTSFRTTYSLSRYIGVQISP